MHTNSVPDAALMKRCLLFGLLQRVMAGLAEGLQVGLIPEETLITTMGFDVVADRDLLSRSNYAATAWALAAIEVTKENLQP